MKILSEELAGAFTRPPPRDLLRLFGMFTDSWFLVGQQHGAHSEESYPWPCFKQRPIFTKRRWSTWAVACSLCRHLLKHLVPSGAVHLAGDDTVDEHRGAKAYDRSATGMRCSCRDILQRLGT
jgi:hypothetical protein